MFQLITFLLLISRIFADLRYGLSEADRQQVLLLQNQQRSIVAKNGSPYVKSSTAAGMPGLRYDTKNLEFEALQYAYKQVTKLGPKEEKEGYTLYHTTGNISDSDLILADVKNRELHGNSTQWSPKQLTSPVFATARDYIQMIWGRSGKVGCAAHRWADHTVLVCRYDYPARVGKVVYEVGKPCSACTIKEKCDEDSKLCVWRNEYWR